MFGWLKRLLGRGGRGRAGDRLACVDGTTYLIVGATGLRLIGTTDRSRRLIGETNAVDEERFWRIWNSLQQGPAPRWSDEEEFRPGG